MSGRTTGKPWEDQFLGNPLGSDIVTQLERKARAAEMASWKEKTAAMVKASRALKAGESGAAETYKAAANCKACHTAHRPEEKK